MKVVRGDINTAKTRYKRHRRKQRTRRSTRKFREGEYGVTNNHCQKEVGKEQRKTGEFGKVVRKRDYIQCQKEVEKE